ncbi:steroidogenic acute regulatory protein star, mitochondrial [Acrasis kona]|uniref:Steroidogenic acute regulatory protein star, mitochondrial n=1 Tax=Acrasis kona TaxID=1008807 RepID=A0AAW2Z5I7_9EUKA
MSFTEEEKQNWLHLSKQKLEEAKKDLADNEGWEVIKEDSGVTGYKIDVPNDANKKVKGGGVIKTKMTPEDFLAWLASFDTVEKTKELDSTCNSKALIANPTPELSVWHVEHASPMFMVSGRDETTLHQTFREGETLYKIIVSVDHPSFPKPSSGYVRMNMKLFALRVQKKGEDELEVWNVSHVDPSGYIPAALINARAVGEASMYTLKLKNMIEK